MRLFVLVTFRNASRILSQGDNGFASGIYNATVFLKLALNYDVYTSLPTGYRKLWI